MKLALRVLNCAAILLTAALCARAQQSPEPPLITVTGQSEVRVAPDEVDFTLVVENLDKELLAAKSKNDETVRQALALAGQYGIEPKDVQTSYITVEPRYTEVDEYRRPLPKREFLGYAVSKTILVRLKNISRFEALFTDLLKAGVNNVRDVDFRTSQIRKHKDEARALAIRAAREKAVALTREIGQTIGKAHRISEVPDTSYMPANTYANTVSIAEGGSSEEESTIAPGMITVKARVLVSFRLE
jgi:uncharacterized protein